MSGSRGYDVLVVGAGVAGANAALLLAGAGDLSVAVVERHAPLAPPDAAAFDARTLALSCATRQVLACTGVWRTIAQLRYGEFRSMEVWDSASSGRIRFDAASIGEPRLGYVCENRIVQHALDESLSRETRLSCYRPANVTDLERVGRRWQVRLDDGRSLSARLIIGADGAQSPVRALLAMQHETQAYDQSALIGVVRTEFPHGFCARQRFLPRGPLAFLPLHRQDLCAVVWSTDPQEASALALADRKTFEQALGEAFGYALGRVECLGERTAVPLKRGRAQRYVIEAAALIGDAAHGVHPLAGQGANLGVMDAAALAEVVADAHARARPFDALRTLRRYERWRKGDNLAVQWSLDGLRCLFANPARPVQALRGFGLLAVDQLRPLKHLIMRRASGLGGDLPACARPADPLEFTTS